MLRSISMLIALLSLAAAACVPMPSNQLRPDEIASVPLEYRIPQIEPVILPNGLRLYLSEDRELPLVKITGMIGTGHINDPAEIEGRGTLFAALLEDGGAGGRSPEEFEEYLESLAFDFSVDMDAYSTTVNLSMLSEDLDAGLAVLDDVLRRPQFNAERFLLARRQMIESIRRQDDDPHDVARRAFNAAVYNGHSFGRSPTLDSVGRIDPEHFRTFHRENFVPENLWLAISGDFDKQEMAQRIRALFGDWQRSGFKPVAIPPLPEMADPAIWLAEKDIPQTTVMLGGVGVSKDNPDMLTVRVMNAILGGSGFNSRLMREIRSNRGLAYSVYSYYMIGRRLPGSFIASGETKNATAMQMVALMLDEMNRIRTELVSEQELRLARQSRINSFVFAFTDSHNVLTQQMRLDFYQYPADYLQAYRKKVMAITREDVLRVARKYLQPDKMTLVLVGQPDQFDAAAEKLQRPVRKVKPTLHQGGP